MVTETRGEGSDILWGMPSPVSGSFLATDSDRQKIIAFRYISCDHSASAPSYYAPREQRKIIGAIPDYAEGVIMQGYSTELALWPAG